MSLPTFTKGRLRRWKVDGLKAGGGRTGSKVVRHGRPRREAKKGAGQHAKGSGVFKGQGATCHSAGHSSGRADVEEGGRQQGRGALSMNGGRQSAEDQFINQQPGSQGKLNPSTQPLGPCKAMPKGWHFLGSTAREGHVGCRAKGKVAGREGRTSRPSERKQGGRWVPR